MSSQSTERLSQIAQVLKSYGADGGLIVGFRDMTPEDIDTEEPVFIEFDGLPVPFFFVDFQPKGSRAIARLNDVNSLKDAEELVGKPVFIESDGAGDGQLELDDLIGWRLLDEGGVERGIVTDYEDIPGNPCLVLNSGAIIPLHEDLIIGVDADEKSLQMRIPEGL